MGEYSISRLSAFSGLPVRTIRYYLSQSLIPSAGREGPSTRYPESTLARLRLIRKLQDAHLSLADIKRQLAEIPDEDAIDLAGAPEAPAPEGSALDYVRSLLGGETTADIAAAPMPVQYRSKTAQADPSVTSMADAIEPPEQVNQPQAVGGRSQWERISLGPNIELHVRRPLSRRDNRLVERLTAFARQLQEEEAP